MTREQADQATLRPGDEELARRIFAAWVSHRQGIGMQYAYNRYVKGERIGPLWLAIARMVEDMASRGFEEALGITDEE